MTRKVNMNEHVLNYVKYSGQILCQNSPALQAGSRWYNKDIEWNWRCPEKLIDAEVNIETISPKGTFCDTVQVPSGALDMQLS